MNVSKRTGLTRAEWWSALGIALLWRELVLLGAVTSKVSGDGVEYVAIARSLAGAGSFSLYGPPAYAPTLLRAPLYPAFIAFWTGLLQLPLFVVLFAQVALSLAGITLLTKCVERVRPELARPTLWLLALLPFEAFFCAVYLSEVLATLLVVAALTLPWLTAARWRWWACGLLWGLAALTRDLYLAFALIAAILVLLPSPVTWPLFRAMPQDGIDAVGDANGNAVAVGPALTRRRWSAAVAIVIGTLLVVAPWTTRNYLVAHQFAPISKGTMGYNLWIGTWERNGNWMTVHGRPPYPPEAYAYASPAEKAEIEHAVWPVKQPLNETEPLFMGLAKDRLEHHPVRVLLTWLLRAPRLWLGTRSDLIDLSPVLPSGSARWKLFKIVCAGLNILTLALGLAGLVTAWRAREGFFLWLAWPLVASALLYLPFHSTEARYSQPVYPLLIALAAYGAYTIGRGRQRGGVGEGESG